MPDAHTQVRQTQDSVRTRIVWAALVASMTAVGGGLWALRQAPSSASAGAFPAVSLTQDAPADLNHVFDTRAPVEDGRWQAIVIHHSGSRFGSPSSIHEEHLSQNLSGLGYHFVIGNGRGMADGSIYAGYRWLDQLSGAHVSGERGRWYNARAIAICLVGDGDSGRFTESQLVALTQLVESLAAQYNIPPEEIHLQRQLESTSSPGRYFPEQAFRQHMVDVLNGQGQS
ncbi:MAG: N-acetylmuramoyl-L-alanine amidase [Phycisphaeraceae bacterium]|nr:N-acetylmuramoyl-L-alanine amidase [Phycisphaerales bacterium]MCB9859501.1 N-acetylmuramoyl-L-alanine amidase [Phycisphaeraceae bacterium]